MRVSHLALILVSMLLAACGSQPETTETVAVDSPSSEVRADTSLTRVVMYKSPQCGCCVDWAAHIDSTGRFAVTSRDVANLTGVKEHLGIPASLGSCHTAEVDGYVIEGHVPAREVMRLIDERPEGIVALSVPGMPIGSPGMEVPGRPADAYDVIALRADGSTEVYASY